MSAAPARPEARAPYGRSRYGRSRYGRGTFGGRVLHRPHFDGARPPAAAAAAGAGCPRRRVWLGG